MSTSKTKNAKAVAIIRGKEGRQLLQEAERANSPSSRAKLETHIEKAVGKVEWQDFGGRGRIAHSAIGATGDAVHLAGEPIVNQGDAEIELRRELARLNGDDYEPKSPHDAAAHYFGLPAEGMAEWDTRKGPNRKLFERVARLSQLRIHSGSHKGEATLTFLDHGIGQHPLDFEGTILSLQLGLKAEIPYLCGQYGHGAGLTLNFSNGGQILISRRHPDLLDVGQEDLVGLTIVRKFQPSETGSVHPAYRYMVVAETGLPVAFPASALADPQWHGLRRVCIDYELGAPADRIGDQASGGLYWHMDHLLPDPALPWSMRDERGSSPQWRFMQGVNSRLTARANGWTGQTGKRKITVTGPRKTRVDVTAFASDGYDYGEVAVKFWIAEQEGTNKGNELYGPAGAAETWTINGQVHEARPRDHFAQKPIGLDALKNHLRVTVACDGLSPDAKADVFTTGRQGTAERRAKRVIQSAIDDVLANDEELRALDQQIKEEALRRAADGADRELERALADFNHLFEREVEVPVGAKKRKRKRRGKKGGKAPIVQPPDPITPLHAEPTFLRFRKVVRQKLKVRAGGTASVLVEADALDGYFPEREKLEVNTSPDLGQMIRIFAHERLAGGRMRVHLRAADDATPVEAVLSVSCLPNSAPEPLADSIELEVVPPLSGIGSQQTRKERRKVAPPYRILWKESESGATWASEGMNWSEHTVGEFKNEIAYVNGDFAPFRRMLNQIRTDQRKTIINLYVPPVVMTLVSFNKRETEPPKDTEGQAVTLHPDYRDAGLLSSALASIFTVRRLKKLGFGVAEEGDS